MPWLLSMICLYVLGNFSDNMQYASQYQQLLCHMPDNMIISPEQCRAARGLLGWSQRDLSRASLVNERTVIDFERGARRTYPRTVADLRRAFEEAGIEFIDENGGGAGVRFRETSERREDRRS